MSAPAPDRHRKPEWLPGRGALLAAALAFGLGLVAFAALWWDQRNDRDFYRTEPGLPPPPGQVFEPLPTPLPAGERGSLARDEEEEDAAREASEGTIVEETPAPPPAVAETTPPAAPAPVARGPTSLPRPIQQPAPRYPRDAFRRRESGTVLLRVHVGANGEPRNIDLVASSGSRSLDRAAVEAVQRWRFAPAMRGETPVDGTVQVPIEFSLGR